MNITHASTDDKKTIYRLTHAMRAGKIVDLDGQVIQPTAWAIYEDVDKQTGDTKKVLSFQLDTGEIVGTISETFIREFEDIVEVFGPLAALEIKTSQTKNGRTFVFPQPA